MKDMLFRTSIFIFDLVMITIMAWIITFFSLMSILVISMALSK